MTVDLVIRNARLVDEHEDMFGGIAVNEGKIVALASSDALPAARREIDAEGRVIMPGVFDPHCHLGVNFPYDEDMRTETAAAARGGITTVFLYICNLETSYLPF